MDKSTSIAEYDICLAHGRKCRRVPGMDVKADAGYLDMLVAGSPCPDHSSFGKHNGQTGESAPAFMTLILAST